MTDPLSALDPASRRTIQVFRDASLEFRAAGMQALFTEDCEFVGALSAGPLRGPKVIEAHIRQVFKGVAASGVPRSRGLAVEGRQVVFEWEILDPNDGGTGAAPGRFTLLLDDSGLISRIKVEWNPKSLPRRTNPK
jgi:hypothetical protein